MSAEISRLVIECPFFPTHGRTGARPVGFRGLALECGCELIALPNGQGWKPKPAISDTATGSAPEIFNHTAHR